MQREGHAVPAAPDRVATMTLRTATQAGMHPDLPTT
jgi:hypothetical protein